MRPLERVPAVRRINTDRADAFAVEITGEFTSADGENLCGLLEGAYSLHERLDLLVRIADLESVDLSNLSMETVSFMKDHVAEHVGRCAIIDDGGWASSVASFFALRGSVETRHFTHDKESEAWEWLGAREIVEKV